ncbi:helix-turn-helix transcriptional regulator [Listeria booriae]|uniref:helix-turn-helix domain-containing protein n=1 Tax=Listeria booriae TaxID=1552123 RepID=UPI001628D25F|nr:helix-turn-helix transcriptional regulator [Listeria booriae]MBC2077635.1 helix-turn-helix transcriptional regulator [Listeria booriae]
MIAERLKLARKKQKITQDQLAKLVNTTKATISNYENAYSSPSADMILTLATALNTSTDYLLGKTEVMSTETHYWDLNEKDEQFIESRLEELINDLGNNEAIAFSKDDEIDEETRELLVQSLENSLRLGKMMAKKKYTPKKYRNED